MFPFSKKPRLLKVFDVPGAGIEPAWAIAHRFLRPARLPIPPSGQLEVKSMRRYVNSFY